VTEEKIKILRIDSRAAGLVTEEELKQIIESARINRGLTIQVMTLEEELEEMIEKAKTNLSTKLDLSHKRITTLPANIEVLSSLTCLILEDNNLVAFPESITSLNNLETLDLSRNQIEKIPDKIDKLVNLRHLGLIGNQLLELPKSIGNLSNLTSLYLGHNLFNCFPDAIGNLHNLTCLDLTWNRIEKLPENMDYLCSSMEVLFLSDTHLANLPESLYDIFTLRELYLDGNQITVLSKNICKLYNLFLIDLSKNPLIDLSILLNLESLEEVYFFDVKLPRRYWTKLSEWNPKWLLDEENAEIRRILTQNVGYEKICRELDAVELDTWQEYTILKIDALERIYTEDTREEIGREPMVLLKMTCPSTGHIHILRVPPEMTSAEAAITWVNHGIHPDEFTLQT
jgi:leucine-rich repeat protein SHOC2